jgi:hypothetical protein
MIYINITRKIIVKVVGGGKAPHSDSTRGQAESIRSVLGSDF